jgi:hypothetical protein
MLVSIVSTVSCPVLDKLWAGHQSGARQLSQTDLSRARIARPENNSHVRGATAADAFVKMNVVLDAEAVRTASCDTFDHAALNGVARTLHAMRVPALDESYRAREDRRALHFEDLGYKEHLWAGEAVAATARPSYAPGGPHYNASRDGKCAELVMWYVHHLSEAQRQELRQTPTFALPLMPLELASKATRSHEYDQQIGCTSCHVAVHIPGKPPITPIPQKNSSAPQYPVTCPDDPKTGKPTVWFRPARVELAIS